MPPTSILPCPDAHHSSRSAAREAHAITGWPLAPLVQLDRAGARGCVADLASAGLLTRQSAFVVLACVDLSRPTRFLDALDINTAGAAGVGQALFTRPARALVGAAFGVSRASVPTGYLRALLRIQEGKATAPGIDPLRDQGGYRRLWEIVTQEPCGRKAEALRYCGRITSDIVSAVDRIDPALLHAEIVKGLTTPERVAKANALLALVRTSLFSATDESVHVALRAALRDGGGLEGCARRIIERADVFPPPPLPPAEGVVPLTTAEALIRFGDELQNCARTKIAEVLLGASYIYRVEIWGSDGTLTPFAVELVPLSDGTWMIKEIRGRKNHQPEASILRQVVLRLHALGAVSQGCSTNAHRKTLSSLLGVYRWDLTDLTCVEDD